MSASGGDAMPNNAPAADSNMIVGLVETVVSATGDILSWLVIGVFALIADTYRRIKANEEQIENLDRHITGDEDDPSQPGLLSEVHETRNRVDEMSDKMDQHHRRTDAKLDELLNNDE